ncbi:hypothetical protein [Deminuibacter soli]|uniref:Uncharacterized protein n=1 Tax=Deminuibacter soli TaxID=2291815 RepID=A0A3E1NF64_9BACT|nr:hypothetical protein [Deminuibacter soli]RFM26428.1 hypothetical protein DXN05_19555 [Deminuibacter soli]
MKTRVCVSLILLGCMLAGSAGAQQDSAALLQVSGVYPSLAVFNEHDAGRCETDGIEGGIGAVVPWAGKLWFITYSPHCPNGSSDKLYSIDSNLRLAAYSQSVGGTPAGRMIHRETNQLIIGPYFIDSAGGIRVIPPSVMPGRLTAIARHLTAPADKVYFYDMEGKIYEADVRSLDVKKLFDKPVPGWHGKGAYTGQGRLLIANNGEDAVYKISKQDLLAGDLPQNSEDKGVLASWNGTAWTVIQRRQFTDVTGPGGIYGAPADTSPVWSIGWDKRSVILQLLDGGKWFSYRLPKAARTYDHWGGWYTEWPRIREVGNGNMLMDMHGMFYTFPKTFSQQNSAGIVPLSSHLRYVPDFCNWNGQLVLAADETTMLGNPMAGRSQSNLWFGSWDELKSWGPTSGWGGPWLDDAVAANEFSQPYLITGDARKVLHLSHDANREVVFTLEADVKGNGQWQFYKTVTVPAHGYRYFIFPADFSAAWIRVAASQTCKATVFFHYTGKSSIQHKELFASLPNADDARQQDEVTLIRPAAHNKNLQVLTIGNKGKTYREVDERLQFSTPLADSIAQVERLLAFKKSFETDSASLVVHDHTGTFRLPKGTASLDNEVNSRGAREIESERYMLNAGGTFFEIGRESGFAAVRPICTHNKRITDFCTWRGLLVLSGTRNNAKHDGHFYGDSSGGLWFGVADDLWKMGKPTGEGGFWMNTTVKANEPSLPYLMTGYDKKQITLKADRDVLVTLEINADLSSWHVYRQIQVQAGKTVTYTFPDGYSAHWIRGVANKDCTVTAWLKYE